MSKKIKFEGDWSKLRRKICLLAQSENSLLALSTSNDDSNFWKKCSFGSERIVLSKSY